VRRPPVEDLTPVGRAPRGRALHPRWWHRPWVLGVAAVLAWAATPAATAALVLAVQAALG
jgi:hypothetical protein